MIGRTMIVRTLLIISALTLILGAGLLAGCTGGSERGEGSGGEGSGAEHGGGGEGGREGAGEHGSGGEGSGEGSGSGGEEGSGAMLAPDETFDMVRSGARLVLSYDASLNAFTGTVENTTNSALTRVRIEVHLSNGTELGPTTPVDLAPGEVASVTLPSTLASFTGWVAHAEVGGGEGGEPGGEHGSGGEGSGEGGGEGRGEGGGEGGGESNEAAMSSPIVPLGQSWQGTLGGLAVDARYDAATRSVQATVQNTIAQTQCYVQAEPHLKSGTQTVGELGPDLLGHLSPGEQGWTSVSVASEPSLAGVSFDGYVVHLEVFDCSGPGPVPHTGGEGGEGAGGEGHRPGGEGSGERSGSRDEEGSGAMLAPHETFDMVRGGARLILRYDPSLNAFTGAAENTTSAVLTRVRIEVHLSNGTELGPTTPVDLAPAQVVSVTLPSTQGSFTGWVAHAEVGGGENGESGGEHGSGGESGGEHGAGGESGGEHGAGGGGSGGS